MQRSTHPATAQDKPGTNIPLLIKPAAYQPEMSGLPFLWSFLTFHMWDPVSYFTWGTPEVGNQHQPKLRDVLLNNEPVIFKSQVLKSKKRLKLFETEQNGQLLVMQDFRLDPFTLEDTVRTSGEI